MVKGLLCKLTDVQTIYEHKFLAYVISRIGDTEHNTQK